MPLLLAEAVWGGKRAAVRLAACVPIVLLGSLAGCSIGQTDPVSNNLRVVSLWSAADQVSLRPDYEYLRFHLSLQTPLLVRGYVHASANGTTTETWYSAGAEVLRMQDGRIVATAGLRTDWSEVRYNNLPTWQAALTRPQTYTRQRDQMPGYHYGIQETLKLQAIAAVTSSELKGINPASLQWFEETVVSGNNPALPSLPPTQYAVQTQNGKATVVYAQQCLAPDLCFSWQRWPVKT